jgi:hypothetical protein
MEAHVSQYLRDNFTFVCFRVDSVEHRRILERGLIALLAQMPLGAPSANWLGHYSDRSEIVASGLWNVNHVNARPLTPEQYTLLRNMIGSLSS